MALYDENATTRERKLAAYDGILKDKVMSDKKDIAKQAYNAGAENAYTTIDQDLHRVYGQGGLAGLSRDEQIQALNAMKSDYADMIYNGNNEAASLASQSARNLQLFTQPELDGITEARQNREFGITE